MGYLDLMRQGRTIAGDEAADGMPVTIPEECEISETSELRAPIVVVGLPPPSPRLMPDDSAHALLGWPVRPHPPVLCGYERHRPWWEERAPGWWACSVCHPRPEGVA